MDFQKLISVINQALNTKESLEVSSFIYDLQDRVTKLTVERSELEKMVVALNNQIAAQANWEQEKKNYEISDWASAKVYNLKGTNEIFCPVCFNKDKMPIHIQPVPNGRMSVKESYCPNCKAKYPANKFE